MKFVKITAAACLAAGTIGVANAAVFGTLTYDMPSGFAASNDAIPIYLTLTLDATSDVLQTDGSGQIITGGPSNAEIIAQGGDPALITSSILNVGLSCTGNFLTACASGPYSFNFNYGPGSFIAPVNLDLQPGSVTHWFLGSFLPVGGNAPAGNYTLGSAGFGYQFGYGTNNYYSGLFNTCSPEDASCAFTRTVTATGAVPEPATWAMMLFGFGLVGGAMRRRVATRVSALD
jgi:hypothetical protein